MYKINFYTDQSGNVPVRDYLDELASKNDKEAMRIMCPRLTKSGVLIVSK